MGGTHERLDEEGPIAVLSPHFDDAVLSCWHLLEADVDLTVVNVFTGSPAPGTPAPEWDRLTGATDPAARMRERRAEDRRALALGGRPAVSIGLLDQQYRREARPLDTVIERLRAAIPPEALLCAPAAPMRHPDHEMVRDAALELARPRSRLLLYADLPHATRHGQRMGRRERHDTLPSCFDA